MKRFALLALSVSMLGLTGCCCSHGYGNSCPPAGGCSPCGAGYGAYQGAFYSGNTTTASLSTPTYASAPAVQTASFTPAESLPSY